MMHLERTAAESRCRPQDLELTVRQELGMVVRGTNHSGELRYLTGMCAKTAQ